MTNKELLKQYLDSEEGKAIMLLIAYTIRKSPTEKDDIVLDNIDDVVDVIAEKVGEIADNSPTDQDAKNAGVLLLEKIAEFTKTKWDDRAVAIVKALL